MREIKFRAWYGKFKQMSVPFNPIFEPMSWRKEDGDVFMQYTGLIDKNGKEIYEGDYVAFNLGGLRMGERHEVFYSEAEAMFLLAPNGNKEIPATAFVRGEMHIIGNVYENPELLH